MATRNGAMYVAYIIPAFRCWRESCSVWTASASVFGGEASCSKGRAFIAHRLQHSIHRSPMSTPFYIV